LATTYLELIKINISDVAGYRISFICFMNGKIENRFAAVLYLYLQTLLWS